MPTSRWFMALAVAGAIAATGCAQDADTDDGMADEAEAPADVVDDSPAVAPAPAPATDGTAPQVDAAMLPAGVTQAMIDAGRPIFAQTGFCYTCHGQDGTGSQLAPDLTDGEWIHAASGDFEQIVQLITNGVPEPTQFATPMPPRGGAQLTDEQVRDVAAYVWALSHGG